MRRPERHAGLLALVLGLLHWWLRPDSGTDLAAQLARASFAGAAPLTPVDLSWYGGVHPFGYSLLSPWLMALLGVHLSGLLAAVAGAVLLARMLRDTERPLLGALLGSVLMTADVVSGRTTFALGAAAALGALCVLPRRRWAVLLAVLTALLSPVAAAFLGFAAGLLVLHRRVGGWSIGVATALPVVVLGVLFPGGGVQPYTAHSARLAVVSAVLVAVLTQVPVVRTGALLYAVAVLAFLLHEDPFGSNVLRLGLLVAAPVLVATARRRALPLLLATAVVLFWQAGPPWGDLRSPAGPPLGPLRTQLVALGAQRVEVLAPRDHRESWYVAERVPLARGWARQQDYTLNPLFYKGALTPEAYLDWLRAHAVDHVAVPRDTVLDFGSTREGDLLRRGASLQQVWQDDSWTVYAVPDPVPLAAVPATVVASGREALTVRVDRAADVVVHLRWSRWLSVSEGDACLERSGDEVLLRVHEPGVVTIGSRLVPKGHCH
ncbi:MAG TPA: hypothetical protein VM097_06010 [Mycobacteriales bacterium]|nr:hypothetical protein [Mycobacteriales bacterium]